MPQANRYLYANGSPLNLLDPDGHLPTVDADGNIAYNPKTKRYIKKGPVDDSVMEAITTGQPSGDPEADAIRAEIIRLNAEAQAAQSVLSKGLADVLIEAGAQILLDFLGINDIINCFTKGDLVACGSTVLNIIPWSKLLKIGSLAKNIKRAYDGWRDWKRAATAARETLELTRRRLDDAAQRLQTLANNAGNNQLDTIAARNRPSPNRPTPDKPTFSGPPNSGKPPKDPAHSGRTCPTHSFDPATPVLLADGTTKPISQIRLGDQVTATDPTTGRTSARTVTTLHTNIDTDLVELTIADQDGKQTILRTTAHHPFWDATTQTWVNAAELTVGHELVTTDVAAAEADTGFPGVRGTRPRGDTVSITAVTNTVGTKTMHDVTVADVHTYYVVAGSAPVLVHNCGGDLPDGATASRPAVGSGPSRAYQVTHAGECEYLCTGGGQSVWADGIEATNLLDAKFVGIPRVAPSFPVRRFQTRSER